MSPENLGMTKTTNDVDAADAKRDEAEEINIFIALPGGNASKFKVDCPCSKQQQTTTVQWWLCQGAKVLIHILKGGHAMHENVSSSSKQEKIKATST